MQITEPTSTVPSALPRARHKRRQSGRAALPKKTPVRRVDGGASVVVALHGIHGRGWWMILDAGDWQRIKTTIGDVWVLNCDGRRNYYVRRSARAIGANAWQPGDCPTATLARILTEAPPGMVVLYRDGNPLNLRRANLEVVSKAEAARRRAANRTA